MISYNEARNLGIQKCIDMLGRDFVEKYRNNSCCAYGEDEGLVFCFLGLTIEPYIPTGKLVLTHNDNFPYKATCTVNMKTGEVFDKKVVVPTKNGRLYHEKVVVQNLYEV